jgi:hypothetical protein
MTTYNDLQAKISRIRRLSDDDFAAAYECEISDVSDVRENVFANIEAERVGAGLPELDWHPNV